MASADASKKDAKDIRLKRLNNQKEDDDPRAALSKLISWVLRRGASQAGVEIDADGWVKFNDLCKNDLFKEHTPESLWGVIVDFNGQLASGKKEGKAPRYEIRENEDGRSIRAYSKEQRQALTDSSQGGDAQQMGMSPMFNPMMMMNPFMNPFMMMQGLATQGKYTGCVKSMNTEKGFGFIECQQAKTQYNRDVFVNRAQLANLQVGQHVQFNCELNKQGFPQAKNIEPFSYNPYMAAMMGAGKGKGKDKGKGKGKDKGKDGDGKKGKGKGKDKKAKKETPDTQCKLTSSIEFSSTGLAPAKTEKPKTESSEKPKTESSD